MSSAVERDTVTLARRIAELGDAGRATAAEQSWWSERIMDWAMARPGSRPSCSGSSTCSRPSGATPTWPATSASTSTARSAPRARPRHRRGRPRPVRRPHRVAGGPPQHHPHGRAVHRRVHARRGGRRARTRCGGPGSAFTVDLLGEKTVVEAEADRYAARVAELVTVLGRAAAGWAPDDHLERDDLGPLPRVNVSVKPTALATHYEPLSRRGGPGRGQGAAPAAPAARPRPRRVRPRRHGALRRQGPDPPAVPRAAVRGRVRRRCRPAS